MHASIRIHEHLPVKYAFDTIDVSMLAPICKRTSGVVAATRKVSWHGFHFLWRRMKQGGIVILLLSVIMLFGSGCIPEKGIDKKKFSELQRIAREIQTSITSGNPCDVPDTLRQSLVSGTEALRDKTTSTGERDLIKAYSNLLTIYNDGLLLCKYRTALSQFQFVPKGRIYVTQELDPLVQKYDLSTASHVYRPTGAYWKSIPGDSIKVIWESAEFQLKTIENMVNYN